MGVLLTLENMEKKIAQKNILRGINIKINEGEFVLLKGANGSGKTTLFHAIMNLIHIDAGKLFWQEKDIHKLPTSARVNLGISFMPQLSTLISDLRVDQTLTLTRELLKGKELKASATLRTLLDRIFDAQKHNSKNVLSLSRGESRKFEFILSLLLDAKLYMFDEPTSGWDAQSRKDAYLALSELKKMGKSILLCDHTQTGFVEGLSNNAVDLIDAEYEIKEATLIQK